jgi:hypothetical protein
MDLQHRPMQKHPSHGGEDPYGTKISYRYFDFILQVAQPFYDWSCQS